MSDTPRTDEEWYNYPMSADCHGENYNVVRLKYARQLERELTAAKAENAAMREAMKEAHDLVRWLVPNSDGLHHRTATAAISKLQPYLK